MADDVDDVITLEILIRYIIIHPISCMGEADDVADVMDVIADII